MAPSPGRMGMRDGADGGVFDALLRAVEQRRIADLATVISAPEDGRVAVGAKMIIEVEGPPHGTLGHPDLDLAVLQDARDALEERKSRVVSYLMDDAEATRAEVEVYHEVLDPQPQLLILGAGHIAVPLVRFGKMVGFEVVVVDDREKYANRERFPEADRVVCADFGETLRDFPITVSTYVVIITRAHTYDEEALRLILGKPAAYIGMIGSRRRVQTVFRTLASERYGREQLEGVRAPIGLDIGSELPEEIALAIISEVVATRRGGTGEPLSRRGRPVAF